MLLTLLAVSLYHFALMEYLHLSILVYINLKLQLYNIFTFGCVNAVTYVWEAIFVSRFTVYSVTYWVWD